MTSVADISSYMDGFAPPNLAEEWDNTGLLVGDRQSAVRRLMTCLTITPESAGEAVADQADLIVAHHPLPFRPLNRITSDDPAGRLLLSLIEARIAVISPHTSFDSAPEGINRMLADRLGLEQPRPLVPASPEDPDCGAARLATLDPAIPLARFLETAKSAFGMSAVRYVGDPQRMVRTVALACGSGGSFLETAGQAGCDTMVTGEATFHTCLAARAAGLGLVLLGHHNSERFAVEALADRLGRDFPDLQCWASRREADPILVG